MIELWGWELPNPGGLGREPPHKGFLYHRPYRNDMSIRSKLLSRAMLNSLALLSSTAMLSTLMLQNLPDWWLTRDLVAWLGCVRCLAFCVFESNLAGNFWVGFEGLGGRWGF